MSYDPLSHKEPPPGQYADVPLDNSLRDEPALGKSHGPGISESVVGKEVEDLSRSYRIVSGSAAGGLSIVTILGGMLVGTVVAVGNHLFFSFLNGRHSDVYPQFWISTAKNIFPKVVQVLFGLSIGFSLTQIVWYHAGRRSYTLPELDRLFNLSSIVTLLRTTFSRQVRYLLPLILIEVTNISLSMLPVFVPGALTIESGLTTSLTGQVPTLDLSSIYSTNAANMNTFLDYLVPSATFRQVIRAAATTNVASGWDAPEGECRSALACSYTFQYTAPALRCADLIRDEIGDSTDSLGLTTTVINLSTNENLPMPYNAISNLNRTATVGAGVWDDTNAYNLVIACNPHFGEDNPLAPSDGSDPSPVGSSCVFWNATYSATTTFANNSQTTSARILSYNYPLSPANCSGDISCSSGIGGGASDATPAGNSAVASRAMAETFVDLFLGNLTFYPHTGTFLDAGDTTSAQYTPLFSINDTLEMWSFDMTSPSGNLSQDLTDLFTNTTLAFISIASNLTNPAATTTPSTLVEMVISPSYSVYSYAQWKLFLIYGVALLAVCVVAVYGLWCIRTDVHPGNMDFSVMAAATRDEDVGLALTSKEEVRLKYCWDTRGSNGLSYDDTGARGGLRKVFRAVDI